MDIEEYIEKIIENGRIEDMEELSDMLEDTMEIIKDYDSECYEKMELKLYKMAYGNKLPDSIKIKWVENMRPLGRWQIQDMQDIYSRYGVDMPLYSLYVIMNMLYSDMKRAIGEVNSEEDVLKYIQASNDWYYDEDAKNTQEAKLTAYWENVVN